MKLEKYLVLNKYLLSLFGAESISDLRDKLKGQKEDFDNNGKSFFVDVLIGLENLKIDQNKLLEYDSAIRKYSQRLSDNRRENIVLKYFQYLAVLFSEIYLDRYFNERNMLLSDLNEFFYDLNQRENVQTGDFTEKDLKKLAYWMATGSGKTLIMHINYWQFLKYNTDPLDNIILVTPNDGLSKQHYNEMQKSGVQCRLYSENPDNLTLYKDQVLIIDIHKLTEEKKGSGVRIETSNFEGRNLIFIDEGHKGQATEEKTWKKLREDLGKNGFVFEYSATFGQVVGEKDQELLNEYSKAIILDYSYKYFYEDGYGKDFYVYNLKEDSFTEKYEELILTANLLSFYEQSVLYEKHKADLKPYMIEKPLWAFIGSKVTGAGLNSDVLKVVLFLKKVIEDSEFIRQNIDRIISGKSGLKGLDGEDIFKDRYKFLRENGYNISDIYQKMFNANVGVFSVYELKSAEGELGLKIGDSEYFGVVNIGDISSFKKLLNEKDIEVKPDNFTPSLFEMVNEPNSNINILIGAKKFIEGWDSWRVCSMGLINIGKGEGPQIIQLFGRGIRLKGEGFSLKRSSENRYEVRSLETLNIFGLNADYINSFLDAIRTEEVEYEEIKLPIRLSDKSKWKTLYTLKPPKDFDFTKYFIKLGFNKDILKNVKIDLRPKVKLAHGLTTTAGKAQAKNVDLKNYSVLFNWDRIYLKMLEFKMSKGYFNLGIQKNVLKQIIEDGNYEINAEPSQIMLKTISDMGNLEEISLMVLKNYVERFYNHNFWQTEARQLQFPFMTKDEDNLSYDHYTLKIEIPKDKEDRRKRKNEIEKIKKLIGEVDKLYQKDLEEIPTIHFDKHLYTPLVVYDEYREFIKSEPVKLNKGETDFVKKMRDYLKQNQIKDKEVFLLRNLSRRGVGFFQNSRFYPDFIMWVKEGDKQAIIFIDPKGIRNLGNFNDEKIQLHKNIKETEQDIKNKVDQNIQIESLILSVSKYEDVKKTFGEGNTEKSEFERNHVLFMDDTDLIDKIFRIIHT